MSADTGLGRRSTGNSPQDLYTSQLSSITPACVLKSVKKKPSSDLSTHLCRKKRIKHVHWEAAPSVVPPTQTASNTPIDTIADLRQTKDICDFFRKIYETRCVSRGLRCVGYLQDADLCKHSFYIRDDSARPELKASAGTTIYSIQDVLSQSIDDAITMKDQLSLAHKCATAVLQYNGTPWLSDDWRLENMRYLGQSNTLDALALKTLHLNSEISQAQTPRLMEGIQLCKDAVTNEVRHGIANTTLFCLGVALLEIAYWTPIEKRMTKNDESNPVLTARRLQKDRYQPLGPEYHGIVKKCLSCDFGFGDQLSEKGLQSAVYTNVVCELEELIAKFSKLGIK